MIHEMLQKEVLKSIRNDNVEEGIFLLEQFIDENGFIKTKFAKSLTSISRRLKELDRSKSLGVIDFELYALGKNKIVDSLLFLLDDVESLNNSNKPIHSSEITSTDIWVIIKGNYDDFNENQQQEVLSKIGKALKIDQNIQIKQIHPGSIRLLLNLPIRSAVKLFKMIKEGALEYLNIFDAYFNVQQSLGVIKNEPFNLAHEATYYEIGYKLGLLADEKFKDNFIGKYKTLYEENISKENKYRDAIEMNLNRQLEKLGYQQEKKIENLNRLKGSIYLLEFLLEDKRSYHNPDSGMNSNDLRLIEILIDRKYSEIKLQEESIKESQMRIDELNTRINFNVEILDNDTSSVKEGYWKNKVLDKIEEIEKGFAHGYTQKIMNWELISLKNDNAA